ncbi:MAG: porin family protein [Gammaproteobacteria bacterium]|nr:porin family protein [Gammaproteobacteria bacterium]
MERRQLKKGLIVLGVLFMSSVHAVQNVPPGYYTRLSGGVNVMPGFQPTEIYALNGQPNYYDGTVKYSFEPGAQGDIAFGYRFPNLLRAEVAWGTIKDNMTGRYTFTNGAQNGNTLNTGYVQATTYMLNAYYDFPAPSKTTPYVGAGVGYVQRTYYYQTQANAATGNSFKWDINNVGVQVIAGLGWDVAPRTTLLLDYRFLFSPTQEVQFSDALGTQTGTGSYTYLNNLFSIGLMYVFA